MEGPDERLTEGGEQGGLHAPERPSAEGAVCRNCARPLEGNYCATCGQSAWNFDVPLVRFVKEFLSESFDLDARLRQTVGPLFLRPGYVAAEYVAGHRARFVPPIRMYILASFVMFLVLSLTAESQVVVRTSGEATEPETSALAPETPGSIDVDSGATRSTGPAESMDADTGQAEEAEPEGVAEAFRQRLSHGTAQAAADPEAFTDLFLSRLAQGMFLLLPAFALLLKGLWRERLYVHHLIFSISFHTVLFFVIAISEIISAIPGRAMEYVGAAFILAVPAHLVLGVKRFYGSTWWSTILKSMLLGVGYLVVLTATLMGLLLLSVLYL